MRKGKEHHLRRDRVRMPPLQRPGAVPDPAVSPREKLPKTIADSLEKLSLHHDRPEAPAFLKDYLSDYTHRFRFDPCMQQICCMLCYKPKALELSLAFSIALKIK